MKRLQVYVLGIASALYGFLAFTIAQAWSYGGRITIDVNHFGEAVWEILLFIVLTTISLIATLDAWREK